MHQIYIFTLNIYLIWIQVSKYFIYNPYKIVLSYSFIFILSILPMYFISLFLKNVSFDLSWPKHGVHLRKLLLYIYFFEDISNYLFSSNLIILYRFLSLLFFLIGLHAHVSKCQHLFSCKYDYIFVFCYYKNFILCLCYVIQIYFIYLLPFCLNYCHHYCHKLFDNRPFLNYCFANLRLLYLFYHKVYFYHLCYYLSLFCYGYGYNCSGFLYNKL